MITTTTLACQKHLFTIPDNISYINCAYMGPLMRSVEEVGMRAVRQKSNPWGITPADFFNQVQELKKVFSELIHCEELERIAINPSASYGLASVAKNIPLKKGQHILLASEQFPSNYYTWDRLAKSKEGSVKIISPNEDLVDRGRLWNEAILAAINENTAAVAIGNVHWADGTLYDLKAIRKATSAVGALLIIDGSQSVGALPINVSELQPDALIVVGYKWLMGPYGTALSYFGPAFDNGTPIEENWMNRYKSEDFQNLVQYESKYKPFANRYNVGETSQFIHVPMLIKSIEQLLEWGVSNIQNYCYNLTKRPLQQLLDMGCHVEDLSYRTSHLVGIHLPKNIDVDRLKVALIERSVNVSFRGTAIRIAPNVYNNETDFERLLDAFQSL